MSAPDIDRQVMDKFVSLAGDAHLTLLLGAGASASSGLPDWDDFALKVVMRSGLVNSERAARTLLEKQDPTIALEAARNLAGVRWATILNDALYGNPVVEPSESPLHLASAGHYLADPNRTTLSTLNFDMLIESALQSEGAPVVYAGVGGELKADKPTVHHLHGVIANGRAHQPIVGYRDFAELVATQNAWQYTFLQDAVQRGPLLLAGTSYRDPDIRHWLYLILKSLKGYRTHPVIVTIVREGLGLDQHAFKAIERALVAEWESIGLTALTTHDLADVALVVRELSFVTSEGYMTPTERSRALWNALAVRMKELQGLYADQLARDSAHVGEALGTKAHRSTLWIANGRGKLARWATEGTRYEAVRKLKLVPTGHDSPWIAGEAIGSENVKLRDVGDRSARVTPSWKSVLAIPIFVGDEVHPNWASAVVTFGLKHHAEPLLGRERDWQTVVSELSTDWGDRLSHVAFGAHGE